MQESLDESRYVPGGRCIYTHNYANIYHNVHHYTQRRANGRSKGLSMANDNRKLLAVTLTTRRGSRCVRTSFHPKQHTPPPILIWTGITTFETPKDPNLVSIVRLPSSRGQHYEFKGFIRAAGMLRFINASKFYPRSRPLSHTHGHIPTACRLPPKTYKPQIQTAQLRLHIFELHCKLKHVDYHTTRHRY
jgi:hypothetical protein